VEHGLAEQYLRLLAQLIVCDSNLTLVVPCSLHCKGVLWQLQDFEGSAHASVPGWSTKGNALPRSAVALSVQSEVGFLPLFHLEFNFAPVDVAEWCSQWRSPDISTCSSLRV